MAKYRSLVPVSYVADGAVVSVTANREIELTDDQALALAGKVAAVSAPAVSMFPDGNPVIDHVIVRTVPATPVASEPPLPEPVEKPAKRERP